VVSFEGPDAKVSRRVQLDVRPQGLDIEEMG
jgi:hypothetical protein